MPTDPKANKKIVLVTSNFPPIRGGSASVYASLAGRLPESVIVLAPRLDYADGLPLIGWREHDRNFQCSIRRIPLVRTILQPLRPIRPKWMWRLWDLALRTRVLGIVLNLIITQRVRTVCIGELAASGWLVKLIRWVPCIRTVIYVHGEEITTVGPDNNDRPRLRSSLLASDAVIVVSNFSFDVTKDLMGVEHSKKLALIPNGVDITKFVVGPKPANLERLYQLQDRFVFVSVCRLVEKKGLDYTIRAFERVVASFPECRLLLVGTGPYEKTLRSIRTELGLESVVLFAGSVTEEELVAHYQLGDVFVMPNRALPDGDTEGFGLVFLEANSCGIPVIAGRDGGSLEAVEAGYNGLVVNGHSLEEIADAMMLLRRDSSLRDTLRTNGLARARASDWNARAKTFLEVCLG